MDKRSDHKAHEKKVYKDWEASGGFKPSGDGKPYCIIMPPPNANDPLHVGHAMFVTVEDILIRVARMRGLSALWLPGTDHAGIETQFVFEKKLKKDGKSRFDFDRKTLFKMIWDYVQENSGIAIEQMKRIGASADWSRLKFTLNDEIVKAVLDTFIKLHKDGLVYRDLQLVNYCTKCGTAFSNLEVKHEERQTPLFYMKYGPFTLATTRPETKFGDTAIAVNPKDKRYLKWIGKKVEVKGLIGKFNIKVIADELVDPEFGTGVVKITPGHDFNDFEVGKRHNLEVKQVIDFDGKLNKLAGKYRGLRVVAARKQVAQDLKKAGFLEKVDEKYVHNIGLCYRCNTVIEPLPLPQFFIKVKPLVKPALKALKEKRVKIYGSGHDKILKHWLENLKDWNVSRQIVWGIQIPVWYKKGSDKSDYVVTKKSPGKNYVQETDTFDTWFSSAQWPWVTLKTGMKNDFENFYPTKVMETGYDILPFWVMRMLMMGIYKTKKVPFEKVYLHGLVRDEKGLKMSKSRGNVINPIDVTEKYGADALRMALVMSSTAGRDKSVGEDTIRGMRNLTNKIWNAARFVMEFLEDKGEGKNDKVFENHLRGVVKSVSKQLDLMKPGLAAETAYNEFWHWYCDESIEKAKKGEVGYKALVNGLEVFLKLLHPFVPFVTEAVWEQLQSKKLVKETSLLMNSKWPSKAGMSDE